VIALRISQAATTVENLDTCHVSALRLAKKIVATFATIARKVDTLLVIAPRNVKAEAVAETGTRM